MNEDCRVGGWLAGGLRRTHLNLARLLILTTPICYGDIILGFDHVSSHIHIIYNY